MISILQKKHNTTIGTLHSQLVHLHLVINNRVSNFLDKECSPYASQKLLHKGTDQWINVTITCQATFHVRAKTHSI